MKNIFGIVGMDVIMAPGAEAGYLWEKINLEKSVGCERGGGGAFLLEINLTEAYDVLAICTQVI